MATNYAERVYKISVDGAAAVRQLEKISGSASAIDQKMASFGSTLKKVFVAGAVIASVKTFSNYIKNISQDFDKLGKSAQSTGIAVEELSKLRFAAEQSGVEFEKLQSSLVRFNVNMGDVAAASTEAGKTLKALGVTVEDDTATAFEKVVASLAAMPDGFQKTAAAVDVFGKSGAQLIPLINEGPEGLAKLKDRAVELGLELNSNTVKALTIFNDSLAEIGKVSEGVENKLIEGLAPAFAEITKVASEAASVSNIWVKAGKLLGDVLTVVFQTIAVLFTDIQFIINGITSDIQRLIAVTSAAVSGDFAKIPEIWRATRLEQEKARTELDAYQAKIMGIGKGLTDLEGKANTTNKNLNNLGKSKGEKDPLVTWYEGLQKASEEMDRLNPKLVKLADEMDLLTAAGKENSSIFKVLSEEYEKLYAQAAKDDVGTNIMLGLRKTKEEAALTAEKIAFLQQTIESMLAVGNTADAAILTKTMKELQAQTESVGVTFKDVGDGISQAIAQNANNAVNSFIDNIGQAEISFGDFATAVLKDVAKLIVQLLVLKPLMDSISGYFGGFGGGGVTASAQGNAFSGGTGLKQGIYSQPTLFKFAKGGTFGGNIGVLGEGSGPEAIMPLKRTASGDLGVQGSPVNVNVYNNAGAEVKTEESMSSDGTRQIDIYIERKMREGISNGTFDKAFRGAYGLSRMGA